MGKVDFVDGMPILDTDFFMEWAMLSNDAPEVRRVISEDLTDVEAEKLMRHGPVIIPTTRREIHDRLYTLIKKVGEGVFVELVIKQTYHPLTKTNLHQAMLAYYEGRDDVAANQDNSKKYEGLSLVFYWAGQAVYSMVATVLQGDKEDRMLDLEKIDNAFYRGSTAMQILHALAARERREKAKE
ncbi:MAG: hypothetical protein LBQ42_06120 [Synergistaceae bacterium]|jgi:hypothetical protein|nr:hypothetical protein [Synergistaceae bacterium]